MLRFIAHQVGHRRGRSLVLASGILIAAAGFTLLTAEVSTSVLEVRGTVARNWRPAYDILVRPRGSFTPLERTESLVRANYLNGIYGGITLRQWRQILGTPGVAVAAPIENVGYVFPFQRVLIPISGYLTGDAVQLYRVHQVRIAGGGVSRYPGADLYVYVTTADRFVARAGDPLEVVPGRRRPLAVCDGYNYGTGLSPRSPFDLDSQSYLDCYSSRSAGLAQRDLGPSDRGLVAAVATVYEPLFVAAVDPVQEDRLVGLDRAVESGRALRPEEAAPTLAGLGVDGSAVREIPVIASTTPGLGETLRASVERLGVPPSLDVPATLASDGARAFLGGLPGRVVGTQRVSLQAAYQELLAVAAQPPGVGTFESLRTVSSVRYREVGGDRLAAVALTNPRSVWRSAQLATYLTAPTENADVQYRAITAHPATATIVEGVQSTPGLRVVGRFDPARLPGFGPLSAVPLETYFPPVVVPANPASRAALRGGALLPTMNIGGYLAQPPVLLTTLRAAGAFFDPRSFQGVSPAAPIAVVRVRVSGRVGADPASRDRVRRVAQAIQEETGLAVDITAGSSPTSVLVRLPAGRYGQPPLVVAERWVRKGVDVSILRRVDAKSVVVFVLVLAVSALFGANAAAATVRSRRSEIGILRAVGWTRGALFRAVLGENAAVGLAAGVAGAVLGLALAWWLGLVISRGRVLLIAPVAVLLASGAGLLPAWTASRGAPLDAVRPGATGRSRSGSARTIRALAVVNLRRSGVRTACAVGAVAVGVGAVAFLLSVQVAFRGALVGTALGHFVSLQVRGADLVAAGLVAALAFGSVADVCFLNMRERAGELASLRATGWRARDLRRMVLLEGALTGLVGSGLGGALGVGLAAWIGGRAVAAVGLAAVVAVGGTVAALLACAGPAARVGAVAAPAVLAQE